jgi:hypothetical protein
VDDWRRHPLGAARARRAHPQTLPHRPVTRQSGTDEMKGGHG